jgi:hypothetical protein
MLLYFFYTDLKIGVLNLQRCNSQIRMIGNYTISELSKFKIIYLETGILKGPKDIIMDQKWKEEYIQYMNN